MCIEESQGEGDISPKGNLSGAMVHIDQRAAWYANRQGNRWVDSFRNILEQSAIAAAALIPESTRMVLFSGVARISTDASMRECFAVEGKTPHLVTCIEEPSIIIRESPAVIRAGLWPAAPRVEGVDPAAMFVAYVKLSKAGGLQAKFVRSVLSVPGLMEKGLQLDYKNSLY
jgi:predicted pyridoxine 5'-phosphate oxidase superfamily flavin-nucleotide-binding protein